MPAVPGYKPGVGLQPVMTEDQREAGVTDGMNGPQKPVPRGGPRSPKSSPGRGSE